MTETPELRQQINKFMRLKQIKRCSKTTLRNYVSIMNMFEQSCKEVNLDTVITFLEKFQGGRRCIVTVIIKNFLKTFDYNFYTKIQTPPYKTKEVRGIDITKLKEMIEQGNIFDKAFLSLLFSSGLRAEEIINIKIKNIDFDKKEIKIYGAKGKEEFETPEIVPFNEQAKAYIICYLAERIEKKEDFLFLFNNEKIKYWMLWQYLRKKFGIKAHQLRHTFCIEVSKVTTPEELKTLARHKSFLTTLKYVNPEKEKVLKEYHEKEIKI